MARPNLLLARRAWLGASLALFGLATRAMAQCPMCGEAAAHAGQRPGQALATFEKASLVLLIPVVLMLGGVGFLLHKFRH